ncbi:SDR family oxidoreductase [Patescibacteria group bacterium]|nr:SDR family oxidoreductase [Patescibacteria group bacterium]MBU1448404.1 SDR family oxidoreductase [Patescibacteria group bacterium]MBU2613036.1 SDR family oxidoreductase [Patescibacteria group bacterium]
MGKSVLVTGGAGFIGSHLCDRLRRDGHEVICFDNLFTGSRENIKHLLGDSRFTFVERDVQDPFFARVDRIFNLACPASPPHYQHDPVATVRTNVLGMMNMLELAKATGARLLQASTSEVYGDPLEHPQRETYWGNVDPLSRRACYDEGKRCAETLCSDYRRELGVDTKIVRIFNTYGPRMAKDDGRVVSNFVLQALRGDDLTVYGDGSYTRSFQYVDDLVEGLVRMMETDDFTGPVNLGNPGEFTILELAELTREMTGSTSRIVHLPAVESDPKQRRPDISFAKERLGWEPTVSLREGLEKTIEYFRTVV